MFRHLAFLLAFAVLADAAAAQPKVIRPGEQPAPRPEPPDLSELSLPETYRALEMIRFVRNGATRGIAMTQLMTAFQTNQFDDDMALTTRDMEIAVELEIARQRGQLIGSLLSFDIDGDLVVTEGELRHGAAKSIQRQRRGILLTQEQRETLILEELAKRLIHDVDGDRNLTIEEISASVDESATRERFNPQLDFSIWDVNGDGQILEVELRRAADAALDLLDMSRNGILEGDEVQLVRRALIKRKSRPGNPTRGKEVPCVLPTVPASADVILLQGERGSAVTNLAFDIPNRPVIRMAEVFVPERERPLYIMMSMRNPIVLRLTGPGVGMVEEVTSVAHHVALMGATKTRLRQTKCFVGFMGIRVQEPGGVEAEFERALGRRLSQTIEAERLGHVDLGTGRNNPNRRLEGDLLGGVKGDAKFVTDWMLSFDPGGYLEIDPTSLTAPVAVSRLEVPPLEIGLLTLAGQGAIEFVEGPTGMPVRRIRTENDTTKTITRAQRGLDGVEQDHLHIVARRFFEMPPGFYTEDRQIRVIVPEGVPKPRGLPR